MSVEIDELAALHKQVAELRAENSALHLWIDAIGQATSEDPEHAIPALAIPTHIRMLHKRCNDANREIEDLERMIDDACYAFDGGQQNGEPRGDRFEALIAAARCGKLLAEQAAGMKVSAADAARFFAGLTEKLS